MTSPALRSQTRRSRRSDLLHRALVGAAVAALAVVTSTAVVAPASAAVPAEHGGNAHVFRLAFTGHVMEAGWSTCPDLAAVPLGTVCRSTDVMAFLSADHEQAVPEFNLHHRKGPTVKVFEGDCQVVDLDGERGCAPLRERFGRTEAATVEVDPLLAHGVAQAEVPVQIWTSDGDSGEGVMSVDASWTGTGERTVLDEGSRFSSRTVSAHSWTRGWQRDCAATATVDGAPVAGEATWCSMLRVRQADLTVFRGL